MAVKTLNYQPLRPKVRSRTRMFIGKLYFTLRRHVRNAVNKSRAYSAVRQQTLLPFVVAKHQTPLYRQLRDVDMWLQENKVINLRLAVATMNGLILKPGEVFSFWRLVGKPTKGKGYVEGMVLSNGMVSKGIGGGLCQLSNLIYWMTLHSPLTVIERWRHTHDVFPDSNRTQPFGSGATVVYNYIDLQIKNDTSTDYQLCVWMDRSYLFGELRSEEPCRNSYQVYESEHVIKHEWWGGYVRHNILRRKIFDDNNDQIGDDFLTENTAIMMYEPLLGAHNVEPG